MYPQTSSEKSAITGFRTAAQSHQEIVLVFLAFFWELSFDVIELQS